MSKAQEKINNAYKEFTATTVNEAILQAAKAFHTERDNLLIKVLSEGKKGLFGMEGASLAKIRVTKK